VLAGGVGADTQYSSAPHLHIPEYAQYRVEGRWRAGTPRAGGVFTYADGGSNPLDFAMLPTLDPPNPKLPVLDRMLAEEAEEMADRGTKFRANSRSIRHQRGLQEGFNRKRFAYWLTAAGDAMQNLMRKNREERGALDAIASRLNAKRERRERLARPLDSMAAAAAADMPAPGLAPSFGPDAAGPALTSAALGDGGGGGRVGRASASLRKLLGVAEEEAGDDDSDLEDDGVDVEDDFFGRRPRFGLETFRPDAVSLAAEAVRESASGAAAPAVAAATAAGSDPLAPPAAGTAAASAANVGTLTRAAGTRLAALATSLTSPKRVSFLPGS